jgi:c-di-AMP phosphodiesterase-like protein
MNENNFDKKLHGKRKFYYCFLIAIVELIITFIIILKFGKEAKEIITLPYVYLNLVIISIYPLVNAVSKFSNKKIGTILDKVNNLLNKK